MLDFKGKSREYAVRVMKRIWLRQLAGAVVLSAVGCVFLTGPGAVSLLLGAVWSQLDNGVVFGATLMSYGAGIPAMRRWLLRMLATRLSLGIIFVVVMLGLKLRVAEAMIGFILLHIFLIFNLQNFTRLEK